MTDRASPQTAAAQLGMESLQRLTQFARDMGRITNLSMIADRILSGLSEVAQYQQGSLYLVERERERFRRLVARGAAHESSVPPVISLDHPLVQELARHQQILDIFMLADGTHSNAIDDSRLHMLESLSSSFAIPFLNRGRLVAFVLLQSKPATNCIDPDSMELLTAMAQSAANALDSILTYEDLHQSQTLMRRTDRLRSLEIIAGGFAHEIRNPLTSIKTFIQLAPDRKDDTEFIRDFSRVVLDDVHRIERLIQEILDYARYMEPKLTDEDLNDIVSSCLYFIEVKADSREIKIEKELASELPRVMLDRQQIKQVLLNLLLNAMDAIGEQGGTLRVRTSKLMKPEDKAWVQIEIVDTGHGISAANLEHIFDPFFTTKHTSGENEGTGLGLTIAHQIIREHQGEIQVQSMEGVGTTFRINLPSLA
ncbi:MAG: GAF domain-containing protein [Nitrospirae bacterium]|nr:GAF domain-containing protein [Nitrospirota bacterium]